MKKILFVLAVVATLFASCTPEATIKTPSVSFQTAEPAVDGDEAVFTVVVSDYTGTEPLTIPVLVETEAVEGTDYEISATEFVWGGENPVTTITVTTLELGTGHNVKLTLQNPEGINPGKFMFSEVMLADKDVNVSFEASLIMTEAEYVPVKVVVTNAKGEFEVEEDTEFTVSVNTEKSTALLGTHFEFDEEEMGFGDLAFVMEGESEGLLYIKILAVEEGKDKIVLRLDEPEGYGFGNYFEVEIRLVSYWEKLAGKWEINEIISTAEFMENMGWWCSMNSWNAEVVYADLPVYNAADALEIVITDENTGVLKPSFQSNLKNYFIGESNMTKGENHDVYLDGMSYPPITTNTRIAICDNINRYFHATEKSKDKEGWVAFGLKYDADQGTDILEMYVIDHTSHSFLPGILEIPAKYGGYAETKPTADMPGQWIGATFKRVAE